jgi:hypothetical protein
MSMTKEQADRCSVVVGVVVVVVVAVVRPRSRRTGAVVVGVEREWGGVVVNEYDQGAGGQVQ